MEYFNEKNMGCFPLVYEDIRHDLNEDEQTYVNKSYEQWLESRNTRLKKEMSQYHEAVRLLTDEKERNDRVINYKLDQFPESMVYRLFNKVLGVKVFKYKKFENINMIFS